MSAKKSTATKEAEASAKVSSTSDFKKRKGGRIMALPSGLVVKARRVELRTFIQHGDVPNMLLPIVEEALNKGREMDLSQIVAQDGGMNLDMIKDMLEMVDKVVMAVCLDPKVHSSMDEDGNEIPEEDRDDDLVYVDEFDDEDKMFLFQWSSGGTDDVAIFRQEAETGLVALVESQGGGSNSK